MATKSTTTGLDTGVVLPTDQKQLTLGFEEVLAGDTAPSAAPEAPQSTLPPEAPAAPVTEAPAAIPEEAPVTSVDEVVTETAGLSGVTPEPKEVQGPPDPTFTKPTMAQQARGTSPQANTYWSFRTEPESDTNGVGASNAMPNGGIEDRAQSLANDVESGIIYIGGTSNAAADTSPVKSVLNKSNALDGGKNDSGKPRMTPLFAKVLTYVVEDALSQTVYGKNEENQTDPMDNVTDDQLMMSGKFTKADANRRIGQEIHRSHQRIINEQAKRPTDAYDDLSPEEAYLLGDLAKELYYTGVTRQYGDGVFMKRVTPETTGRGEQTFFEVTDAGQSLLRQGNTLRKKLLPKDHVRPLKTPPVDGLTGEIGRITRSVTQRVFVPGTTGSAAELNQAMRNLSQVAHVVDPQRLKILLSTALPALNNRAAGNPYRTINHIGDDKMVEFRARETIARSQRRLKIPDPAVSMAAIENDLAQALYGICLDRKGANYLTFYLQGATGRIAVQQTNFDPTTKKSVRFVTRSAVPTMIQKGSRFDKALRQMYAMALVKGADALVPSARESALIESEGSLYDKGKRLREALDQISDEQVERVADAIAQGVSINDPNFPQMPALPLDPNNAVDAALLQEIESKGEDGQAYIDGLIDFANYKEAMDKGQPYHTYFNAYIDGKTNGLAANGMQLGNEDVATRTGVIRSGTSDYFLDDDQDIRDVLEETLVDLSNNEEYEEFSREEHPEVYEIAKIIYGNRGLNKTTSMTFGYGKDVNGFKQDIEEFMLIMQGQTQSSDSKVRDQAIELNQLLSVFDSKTSQTASDMFSPRQALIDAIHSHYDKALRHVLGDETMQSRNHMRGVAFLHSITNDLFSIESPTGYPLYMGGMMTTGATGEATGLKIFSDGVKRETKSQVYGEEATSAAPKIRTNPITGKQTSEVGGTSWGAAIPIPVQSIDAATVARVASNKGGIWKDIRQRTQNPKVQPYVFPIYDAFKMDAASYDAVLKGVNKAWVDINFEWSYLKQAQNSLNKLRQGLNEKYPNNNQELTPNESAMIRYLFTPYETKDGNMSIHMNNKLGKVMFPVPERDELFKIVSRIVSDMESAGFRGFSKIDSGGPKPLTIIREGAQITAGDLKIFLRALERQMKLDSTLDKFIKDVELRKSALRSKVMANVNSNDPDLAVLQYYSH